MGVTNPFEGKKAIVVGKDHSRKDQECECIGTEKTPGGLGLKFKSCEDMEEFIIFDPKEIRWL